jgi:hypothetical protein
VLLILVNTRNQTIAETEIALGGVEGVSTGISVTDRSVVPLSGGKIQVSLEALGVRVLQFQLH